MFGVFALWLSHLCFYLSLCPPPALRVCVPRRTCIIHIRRGFRRAFRAFQSTWERLSIPERTHEGIKSKTKTVAETPNPLPPWRARPPRARGVPSHSMCAFVYVIWIMCFCSVYSVWCAMHCQLCVHCWLCITCYGFCFMQHALCSTYYVSCVPCVSCILHKMKCMM